MADNSNIEDEEKGIFGRLFPLVAVLLVGGLLGATGSYSMTIEPAALAVELNMESGPLVDPTMVEFEGELARLDFPPRARRIGVEGKLELQCQIQLDHSLICLPQSFELPEHFGLFADYFLHQSRRLTMSETLKDGSPSAGARFPLSVNYRLNP